LLWGVRFVRCAHLRGVIVAQVPFALTAIRGLGRRFTTLACKKAGVNVHKR